MTRPGIQDSICVSRTRTSNRHTRHGHSDILISGTHKAADLELASVSTTDLYAWQRKFMVTFTEKRVALLLLRRGWLFCWLGTCVMQRRTAWDIIGLRRAASYQLRRTMVRRSKLYRPEHFWDPWTVDTHVSPSLNNRPYALCRPNAQKLIVCGLACVPIVGFFSWTW